MIHQQDTASFLHEEKCHQFVILNIFLIPLDNTTIRPYTISVETYLTAA